jgi:hypothetical protein
LGPHDGQQGDVSALHGVKSQMTSIRKIMTHNTWIYRHLISIAVCLETAYRYTSSSLISSKRIMVMPRPFSRHTSNSPPGEEMKYGDMASLRLTHIYIMQGDLINLILVMDRAKPPQKFCIFSTRNTEDETCTKKDKMIHVHCPSEHSSFINTCYAWYCSN